MKKNILYGAAICAWLLLLWPYPVTTLLAGSVACAFLPLYRRVLTRFPGGKGIALYSVGFVLSILLPIALLIRLVAPQAAAGLNMLKVLRENNFQLPPHWIEFGTTIREELSVIPGMDGIFDEITQNIDSILSSMLTHFIEGSLGFLGSTMNALWLAILFASLSILCSVYAGRIFLLTSSVLHLSELMLGRFVEAIRGALRGVLLGVMMIALCQGILCGIGFAMAGIKQPAFWGLLATLVAPIPVIGTAIVWFPLCLMLWFTGATFDAVGLFLWGMVAVGGIDNILRPFFLQKNIKAPFIILILSILCGMASFGPVGILIGPVLVTFAMQAASEADTLSTFNREGKES